MAPINRRVDSGVSVIQAVVPNGGCVTFSRLPLEWGGTHGQQWVFFDPPGARYLMFGARYGRDGFFTWNDTACQPPEQMETASSRPACMLRSAHLLDHRWAAGTVLPTPEPAPPSPPPASLTIIARDDSYSMARGSTLTVPAPGVLANDSVPPGGTVSVRFVQPLPSGAAFTNLGGGSFSINFSPGFSGTVTFRYDILAGATASNTATVTVTVN